MTADTMALSRRETVSDMREVRARTGEGAIAAIVEAQGLENARIITFALGS